MFTFSASSVQPRQGYTPIIGSSTPLLANYTDPFLRTPLACLRALGTTAFNGGYMPRVLQTFLFFAGPMSFAPSDTALYCVALIGGLIMVPKVAVEGYIRSPSNQVYKNMPSLLITDIGILVGIIAGVFISQTEGARLPVGLCLTILSAPAFVIDLCKIFTIRKNRQTEEEAFAQISHAPRCVV